MQERDETPESASGWLPEVDLGEPPEEPSAERGETVAPSGRRSLKGRLKGPGLGALTAIAIGVAVALSGALGSSGEETAAQTGTDGPAQPDADEATADRRSIHRGVTAIGLVELGELEPSEGAVLATAAQRRDERIDSRKPQPDSIGPDGSLSLYPIDNDDRYGYLVRIAALATLFGELNSRTDRIRSTAQLAPAEEELKTLVSQMEALVSGLDGSLYKRSKRLHTIVTKGVAQAEDLVDAGRAGELRAAGAELGELGRSIEAALRSAADAASASDPERAMVHLAAVDRRVSRFNDRQRPTETGGEPVLGAIGPSMALSLTGAVGAEDDRAERAGTVVFSVPDGSAVGATTTSSIRAKYVLRLAAVAVLLQELGDSTGKAAAVRGSGRDAQEARRLLVELAATANTGSEPRYHRSRKLERSVAGIVSVQWSARSGPVRRRSWRRLGRHLAGQGAAIDSRLQRAVVDSIEGDAVRAGRRFSAADEQLAALSRLG